MAQYPTLTPFGKMTVATAGTTVLLSVNCGSQQGQTTVPGGQPPYVPPLSGKAFRQMVIQADAGNTKNIYVLPSGKTLSANPALIIAAIAPGATVPIPNGISQSSGYLPENFCLDTDTNGNIAYGFGVAG